MNIWRQEPQRQCLSALSRVDLRSWVGRLGLYLAVGILGFSQICQAGTKATLNANERRQRVLTEAAELFDEYQISYAYGGNRIGTDAECEQCNSCLDEHRPAPKLRFKTCPSCYNCSLDCSHFTQLIFKNAGLYAPYLTTTTMLNLTAPQLMQRYKLVDLGRDLESALPGDLLVYRGHVVMVTAMHEQGRGDIIHATGGRDIREPGQGIQRERLVPLSQFRGPLLRVLRHAELVTNNPRARLRPVRKK